MTQPRLLRDADPEHLLMSQDIVNLEVDGVAVQGRKGQMIIHVTDAHEAYVPRFCYHEKLSVAANCRMCLVEVEKAPKPLPACATPIAEGMKIFTKSPKAIGAQKATMEFLLINHPLDCPICDQGGECELQDLAMGFGRDAARFEERKRVVKDKNIGPLVSTDMTRCIHCTRCVRFTAEIAGLQELGTMGRGEATQISTWVEQSVDHELSGNIIDLCPVGALNSKPFRYQGRSWEMTQTPMVSPHDALGSNLSGHVRRGTLMRVVPQENEAINETWISDRDRFSYEGIYSADRLLAPMVRQAGVLVATDWQTALEAAAVGLQKTIAQRGAASVGVLSLPSATTEEAWLLSRLARSLGVSNLDHRLRQQDFRDQAADPVFPGLGVDLQAIEQLSALLVVGSDLRQEAPLLAHRVRKAATRQQTRVSFINPVAFDYLFPVAVNQAVSATAWVAELCAVGRAIAEASGQALPALLASATVPTSAQQALAAALCQGERRLLLLGGLVERHPARADIRAVAAAVAGLAKATVAYLPTGSNAAGVALAGVLPHREAGGASVATVGLNAAEMANSGLSAYVLFGGVESGLDTASGALTGRLASAEFVLAITPFASPEAIAHAHVVLPIGTFAETSGTFVNVEGRWQSFVAAARLVGEARPGWKVLRVLANVLGLKNFDYESSEAVRLELQQILGATVGAHADTTYRGQWQTAGAIAGELRSLSIYQVDPIVRRAPALQDTRSAKQTATVY
jgi:NADH-quinone oxidoreductase subunit G